MRILIASSGSKLPALGQFCNALIRRGEECKLVNDLEITPHPHKIRISDVVHNTNKFNQLMDSFNPDVIFIDHGSRFGIKALNCNIPVFLHLRGDYWTEYEWNRKTLYRGIFRSSILRIKNNWWKKCFDGSTVIMPICKYLEKITKKYYPKKQTTVLYNGIDPDEWSTYSRIKLEHPCVGLMQDANILGKTMELRTLPSIMTSMPDITFYWAGDGPYLNHVLPELKKYPNFQYLGRLKYPNQVRDFLGTIDIYGLLSGIDMSPLSLLEAQLMKRPVIATNVGGVSENMVDKKTGFLVNTKSPDDWIDHITFILENSSSAAVMGDDGRKFVIKNFSWDKVTTKFMETVHRLCG